MPNVFFLVIATDSNHMRITKQKSRFWKKFKLPSITKNKTKIRDIRKIRWNFWFFLFLVLALSWKNVFRFFWINNNNNNKDDIDSNMFRTFVAFALAICIRIKKCTSVTQIWYYFNEKTLHSWHRMLF